jgi:hypothetical protein
MRIGRHSPGGRWRGGFNVAYPLAVALFLMTFAIGASYARWA